MRAVVTYIHQSPMNPQRWCLTLQCGCEEWVTSKRRPKRKEVPHQCPKTK